MDLMISLIGEQPIPNLLPVRHYKPQKTALVYSDRTKTVSERLQKLIPNAELVGPVDPYNIAEIEQQISSWIDGQKVQTSEVVFNLTGGTKTMLIAAYRLAEQNGHPFIYLQTEGKQSVLYRYEFQSSNQPKVSKIELPGLITIEEYLRVHIDDFDSNGYAKAEGGDFEEAVDLALQPYIDESIAGVKKGGALDIDLVVRKGNRVGIAEIKIMAGRPNKKGIDQLNTAGGRAYLGTYISKFLIIGRDLGQDYKDLQELAEARQITFIELPSYGQAGAISQEDQNHLGKIILSKI